MARIQQNERREKTFRYSEIFHSFQGEGKYTGIPCVWIRFWLCNLQCDGFGQKDPTDPSTYVLPYQDFNIDTVKRVEDLPVWRYGCDSSYTWAKKFRDLMHNDTAKDICDKLEDVLKHPTNPSGYFKHPKTLQDTHMCFTGGEPMLSQEAIFKILYEFHRRRNWPLNVTVETNGTKAIKHPTLQQMIEDWYGSDGEWFWSVSPKLFSTSGEKSSKAIKPAVVGEYALMSDHGQLKYVVNGSEQSWDEVEQHTESFRDAGVFWPVWIMPVGATKEQQEDAQIAEIAVEAMKRGYNVSGRLHCYIFGNQIGT